MDKYEKKLLIVADSHGAGYGTIAYPKLMGDLVTEWEISVVAYGGWPITDIIAGLQKQIIDSTQFDVVILQVGNPDAYPRMPFKPLKYLRKIGLPFMRDALFSVPPDLKLEYFLRLPFFIFRLLFIRLYRNYYKSLEQTIHDFESLISLVQKMSKKTFIMPLFEVSNFVYGPYHNERANEINTYLSNKYIGSYLNSAIFMPSFYNKYYNWDWFHFKQEYHQVIAHFLDDLINKES